MSKLMALPIRLDQLIRDGLVTNQAELARFGHVKRAILTQIMNLLFLAPVIQEHTLQFQKAKLGRTALMEKKLRSICATLCWKKHCEMWVEITK
ncbi:hypothetical protein NA78x_002724 [Anatilimnocola sp. NA78]|uniref:hypothetical protein n=1 Tax=Anatilimnocola sp. NA78 TaxID=3415683 RepID=UPI003CE4B660